MPLLTRQRAAMALAFPALLVPVIEIPLVLWARHAFLVHNPDYLDQPPTISRAISDPMIGDTFANVILVITALILVSLPIIVRAYVHAIAKLPVSAGKRLLMWALLGFFCVAQLVASFGMVLTTQYTFANSDHLHMLGSYIFFPAQAFALLGAAILCRVLVSQQARFGIPPDAWPFRAGMHHFRFRFALVVVFLAITFGVFFTIRDWPLPISTYTAYILYTQSEVLVIASYVVFFGSYAVDIREMVHHGRLPHPLLDTLPAAPRRKAGEAGPAPEPSRPAAGTQ